PAGRASPRVVARRISGRSSTGEARSPGPAPPTPRGIPAPWTRVSTLAPPPQFPVPPPASMPPRGRTACGFPARRLRAWKGVLVGGRSSPPVPPGRWDPAARAGSAANRRGLAPPSEVDGYRCGLFLRPDTDTQGCLDLLFNLVREIRVVFEEVPHVLLALTQLVALIRVPGAGLSDDAVLHPHVDEAAFAGDPLAVDDVELRLLERRGHLVLHHSGAGAVSNGVGAILKRLDPAHIDPHRGVELQRLTTGGGFRAAEEDADLLPQLVDEDRRGSGGRQRPGEFPQRLRHQARLQPHVRITHFPFDLSFGNEGGDGVDDDDVQRAGADEHVSDLQGLLPGVGLGDEQRVGVDSE